MGNYKEVLFDKPNNKSTDIDLNFIRIFNRHGLKEDYKNCLRYLGAKNNYFKDYLIHALVHFYSIRDFDKKFEILKYRILNEYKNVKINIVDGQLDIKTNNYEIHARKLNSFIPSINELFDGIDIESLNRVGKCHEESFLISKNIDYPNKLVTSYVYGSTELSKLLHTFVEIDISGNEFVLDPTINIIMNKDGFYKMNHIGQKDIISIIDNENLKEDMNKYSKLFKNLDINYRDYEVFRDEIINEFNEKNRGKKL